MYLIEFEIDIDLTENNIWFDLKYTMNTEQDSVECVIVLCKDNLKVIDPVTWRSKSLAGLKSKNKTSILQVCLTEPLGLLFFLVADDHQEGSLLASVRVAKYMN